MKNRIFNFGNVSLTLGLGVAVGSIIFVYKSKADQKEVKDSFYFCDLMLFWNTHFSRKKDFYLDWVSLWMNSWIWELESFWASCCLPWTPRWCKASEFSLPHSLPHSSLWDIQALNLKVVFLPNCKTCTCYLQFSGECLLLSSISFLSPRPFFFCNFSLLQKQLTDKLSLLPKKIKREK